jgi:transcriptional regulator GlxA family with amidase domain
MEITFTIIAVENVYLASLAAMKDSLQIANHILDQLYKRGSLSSQPSLRSRVVSCDGRPVKTACGMELPVDGNISSVKHTDVIYLPGIFVGESAERYLSQQSSMISDVALWLKRQRELGAVIATVATGTLIVAEAGLLNKAKVPVPWAMESFLHKRFPGIKPARHEELVESNGIYCAGNLGSSLALAIKMVRRYAPEAVANLIAQYVRPHDLSLEMPVEEDKNNALDPLVIRAQSLIQQRFTQAIDFNRLAKQLAVSQRTLNRRFNQDLGMTPQHYQQQLRIEAAQRLLKTTQLPVAMIVEDVGYTNTAFFCRLFKSRMQISVQDYRTQKLSTKRPAPQ